MKRSKIEDLAWWAFSFHRRNDLTDEELEMEFEQLLEKKLNNDKIQK